MTIEPFKNWLDERLSISVLARAAQKKEVPLHRQSIWYYFGGMTLFLFVVQVVTGILLLLYYRPSAENAFESIQFIMTEVKFGWLIRSIHSWSANLMILTLFIHMFSVYFMRSYNRPRELTWVTGVFLLLLCITFGFSGYLLPWNTVSFFATKVGTDIAGVLLVQLHGMHVPARYEQNHRRMKFFPNFLMRDLIGWILAIGVLAALAALFPWELGVKADAFAPAPAGIKPEWYFLFMFQTLKYIPAKVLIFDGEVIGILFFMLAGAVLFVIPFVNRSPEKYPRRRMIFTALGVVAVLYIAVMTIIGYLA